MNPSVSKHPIVRVERLRDDVVGVGGPPLAAAGIGVVNLRGVTVAVDPMDHAIFAEVSRDGLDVAETLFGADVAHAVVEGADGWLPLSERPELGIVRRAGTLDWLARCRPLAYDPDLLALEGHVAALLAEATDLPPTTVLAGALADVAAALRSSSTVPLGSELLELVRSALPWLPVGHGGVDEYARLAHELAMIEVAVRYGSAALTPGDLAWLADLIQEPTPVHLAGWPAGEMTASLDWHLVPDNLLPAPEDSVTFTLTGAGDDLVWVTKVTTGPDPLLHPAIPHPRRPVVPVEAVLTAGGWPLPVATTALTPEPGGGLWSGRLTLTGSVAALARQAPRLDVRVQRAGLRWTPWNTDRNAIARARRVTARGTALRRLGPLARDAHPRAAAVLDRAAGHWDAMDRSMEARACRALARSGEPRGVPLSVAERWLVESLP